MDEPLPDVLEEDEDVDPALVVPDCESEAVDVEPDADDADFEPDAAVPFDAALVVPEAVPLPVVCHAVTLVVLVICISAHPFYRLIRRKRAILAWRLILDNGRLPVIL